METIPTKVCDSKLFSAVGSSLMVERIFDLIMLPFLACVSISCSFWLKTYKVHESDESSTSNWQTQNVSFSVSTPQCEQMGPSSFLWQILHPS